MISDDTIELRTHGRAGQLRLNRPRALNALTHSMIRGLAQALDDWAADPRVRTVVVSGAGERGLCAGADIRAIYADVLATGGVASAEFFRDEYRLNARIARFAESGKPYVAVMDGLVMGGGVGVSAHGDVRIVTERSQVAMPETRIGLVPDVGGSYLLSRAPGELGTHLALTGDSADGADALVCGLADHWVPAERLPALLDGLADAAPEEVVARYAAEPPPGGLSAHRGWIDACYAADTVEEIVARLEDSGEPAAKAAAETLLSRSPTALKVTLAALRRARELSGLEGVLRQEYRVSCAALGAPDLVEGIRAQVVDKDRDPRWSPATLAEVSEQDVARFFAPLGERELALPGESS
jgi:enoyl-CoA hydratase